MIEFFAGLSTGALGMLISLGLIVLYKARGSRIRLSGMRLLDAALDSGSVKRLTKERDEARRVAEGLRRQIETGGP